MSSNSVTVIYDGQCRLCRASLNWLQSRCEVKAISFHDIDPAIYNLTQADCESQVIALSDSQTYKGAAAVAFLMAHRGNKVTAAFIRASGPIGRSSYRWISTNRNTAPVRALTRLLEKLTPNA